MAPSWFEIARAPGEALRLLHWERDAAYDNNAAVSSSAAWTVERDRAARAFRAAARARLDVPYGPGARHKLDLYYGEAGSPCLVFIHGGYWQRNSREVFAHYAEGVLDHGWSVVMPSHSLAPEAQLGQIVDEVGMALDFVLNLVKSDGFGPVILSGWSAGAQLAVLHLDHPAVAAGVAVSGVYDLTPLRDTYLNAALELSDDDIASFSPLKLPVSQKPLVVAYGTAELPAFARDARALSAWRVQNRAPGALIPIRGADHFSTLAQLRARDGLLVKAVLDLVPA